MQMLWCNKYLHSLHVFICLALHAYRSVQDYRRHPVRSLSQEMYTRNQQHSDGLVPSPHAWFHLIKWGLFITNHSNDTESKRNMMVVARHRMTTGAFINYKTTRVEAKWQLANWNKSWADAWEKREGIRCCDFFLVFFRFSLCQVAAYQYSVP